MIQIDMEMPKSCYECDFLVHMRDFDSTYEYPYCPYLGNEVDISKRPAGCPLQEVKE
jgi:hypothetical protein